MKTLNTMHKPIRSLALTAFVFALLLTGCKDKEPDAPKYEVPTTYNFTNVNYADATARLAMFTEMETEMNKGKTSGVIVDAQKLKDMFANVNNQFTASWLNTSGLQLKDQNNSLGQIVLERYMDSLSAASHSTSPASNGVAGVGVNTADPTKKFLLAGNGYNYGQLFSKSMMGSLITYQVITLLSANADNTTVVAGQGTAMEHNWDLAFGYFDVPVDFPTNKTGVKYWGSYCNQVDSGLHSNNAVMNAFLKGRAAVSNKDDVTRNAQADIIISMFEKMTAGAAIHEIHEAKEDLANTSKVNTNVSESLAFMLSVQYNPKKTITNAQLNNILSKYPSNLYNITLTDLNNIIDAISSAYGLDAVKDFI